MKVPRPYLERIIRETLAEIPADFQRKIENLEFTLEEEPSQELLRGLGMRAGDLLMGLYQGVPRPGRGFGYGNVLPDKITLYRRAFERYCRDDASLRREVYDTLVHEIGHYFGFDEEDLRRIQRGPGRPKIRRPKPEKGRDGP